VSIFKLFGKIVPQNGLKIYFPTLKLKKKSADPFFSRDEAALRREFEL